MASPPTQLLTYAVDLRVFSLLYPFASNSSSSSFGPTSLIFSKSIHSSPFPLMLPQFKLQQLLPELQPKLHNWYSCFSSLSSSCHLKCFPSSLRMKLTLQGLLSVYPLAPHLICEQSPTTLPFSHYSGFADLIFAPWICQKYTLFRRLHLLFPLSKMIHLLIFPGADSHSTQMGSDLASVVMPTSFPLLNPNNRSTTFPFCVFPDTYHLLKLHCSWITLLPSCLFSPIRMWAPWEHELICLVRHMDSTHETVPGPQ